MRRRTAWAAAAAAALLAPAAAPAAELAVGAGGAIDLGTGSLDLGCADLTVAGTLSAGSVGFTAARDVTIQPAGTLNGNSAILELAGSWDDAGSFDPGTGTVRLVDGCSLLSASIFGSSVFTNLEATSTSSKLIQFEAGSLQTITGALTLSGVNGGLLQIRSTTNGVAALLDVQGTSGATYVDVQDNDATAGNAIALGPDSVKGTNTPGWNPAALVPSISLLGAVVVAGLLLAQGLRPLRRRA